MVHTPSLSQDNETHFCFSAVRVTNNLPFRSHTMSPQECFQTFIHAIFYVGKGKRSRPYSHLYEALEYYKGDKTSKAGQLHQTPLVTQNYI